MSTGTPLGLGELMTLHRNQESTELTLLGLAFTVSLGLISLVGSGRRILPIARVLIAVVYAGFMASMLWSVKDSLQIHSALHDQMKKVAAHEKSLFEVGGVVDECEGTLAYVFKHQFKPMPIPWLLAGGTVLSVLVLLGVLSMGEGHVLTFRQVAKSP